MARKSPRVTGQEMWSTHGNDALLNKEGNIEALQTELAGLSAQIKAETDTDKLDELFELQRVKRIEAGAAERDRRRMVTEIVQQNEGVKRIS